MRRLTMFMWLLVLGAGLFAPPESRAQIAGCTASLSWQHDGTDQAPAGVTPSGLAGFRIYQSASQTGTYQFTNTAAPSVRALSVTMYYQTSFFRMTAFDFSGNESSLSASEIVSKTCSTPAVVLTLNPTSFAFTGVAGGANPANQTLLLSHSGGGTLSLSITDNQTWLSVSPGFGDSPGSATVSVTTAGLAAGTYNGAITVSASGASNSPQTAAVTLTVFVQSQPYPSSAFTLAFDQDTVSRFGYYAQPPPCSNALCTDTTKGSDIWILTASSDGNVYGTWSDGVGWTFSGEARCGTGVTRIAGNPPALSGTDLPCVGSDGSEIYGNAFIADGSTLKLFYHSGFDSPAKSKSRLVASSDNGQSWSASTVVFDSVVDDGLGVYALLQAGPGYDTTGFPANVDAAYFYLYLTTLNPSSTIYLARVLKANIATRASYEFFTGVDGSNNALWSPTIGNKVAVFTDAHGAMDNTKGVSFDRGLGKFLITQGYSTGSDFLGVFEGATPWGPWFQMYYISFVDAFAKFNFPLNPTWMSADGRTIWLGWTGHPEYDDLHLIQGTITGGAAPILPPPTLLSPANGVSPSQVLFAWTEVSGAKYLLYIHEAGTPYDPCETALIYCTSETAPLETTSLTVPLLRPNIQYDWWVHSVNTDSVHGAAQGTVFTTGADVTPPARPLGPRVSDLEDKVEGVRRAACAMGGTSKTFAGRIRTVLGGCP